MKCLLSILLLLETLVFVVQHQIDGGSRENEISQQLSNEDRRQNPPQTDTRSDASTDSQQYCHLSFPDIHAALRELTATVTEQKANIRALETRLREELNKKTEEISNLTQSQVEELRKENRDREIAFSAALMDDKGPIGPFTTDIILTYRNVFTNIGNAYNPITGIFTAPLKGAYMFNFSVFGSGNPSTPSTASIVKNGQRMVVAHGHQDQYVVNSSKGVVLILEVGDVVYVTLWSGRGIYDETHKHNTFSGYLLFPLREQEL
ncbi:cerebellin-1-like [Garra rufa]|uniref:cerebellin-1-like n=1 Tax=Garra rufa TaxID=137080 RepID=UPI003CCEC4DB